MQNEEKSSIAKKGLLGFIIGLAVIVPGISGSTVAIIFKLYDKLISAISNIVKEFKKSVIFLFPIAVGAVLGLVTGLFSVQELIKILPFAIVLLFAGLMLGAIPSLTDEIKDKTLNKKGLGLAIIGVLIPISISLISILLTESNLVSAGKLNLSLTTLIILFILGFVVAITQFVPGCSATATLMAAGYYTPILESISMTYWKANPSVFVVYFAFGIGALIGCFVISKIINVALVKYKNIIYYLFVGLSFGSVLAMIFNSDMLEVYRMWASGGQFMLSMPVELILGIVLFIVGAGFAYSMVLYSRRKNAE